MAKWIGYAVSVNCGEPLGCYQGTILEADGNTITLTKAFRNGFPYPKSQVTLNATDIKELKIIESKPEPAEQTHSTVAVTKTNKKGQRATVCENLQANPTNSGANNQSNSNPGSGGSKATGAGPARSKPADAQAGRALRGVVHAGGPGAAGPPPRARGGGGGAADKARRRNEACFGSEAETALDDFDFEGNLALFDKRALWERMRLAPQPDVVRHAARLRPDQNVLPGPPPPAAPPPACAYVSDDGALVPAVRAGPRRRLYGGLERLGLGPGARALLARAACDVALRLVGGGRRLEARNAHQAPVVVALLGAHAGGAAGACAVRLLRAHGARAALHVAAPAPAPAPPDCAELRRELRALALDGAPALALERLPEPDLVLLALRDPLAPEPEPEPEPELERALRWAAGARGGRAPLLALEPPAAGWARWGPACRASVAGALPPALAPALGRLYLANVGAPAHLEREAGLSARPPFGGAALLPLHPAPGPAAADAAAAPAP